MPSVRPGARPRLADDGHLDPARVRDLLLDGRRGLVGDEGRALVIDLARIDDHPNLAARAHAEHPADGRMAARDVLEVAQPRYVLLERLAARPGPRAGDRVRRLDDDRLDRAWL